MQTCGEDWDRTRDLRNPDYRICARKSESKHLARGEWVPIGPISVGSGVTQPRRRFVGRSTPDEAFCLLSQQRIRNFIQLYEGLSHAQGK